MSHDGPRRPGCFRLVFRLLLILVAAVLGILAWDVWQLRTLRPPEDRTFGGFVRDGREGSFLIDEDVGRLYWIAPSPPTVVPYPQPPVYAFDRAGRLVDWTPGTGDLKGMMQDRPVRRRGTPATREEARAWLVAGKD